MNVEIKQSDSYYSWMVYVDKVFAGMIVKKPGGSYTCPSGRYNGNWADSNRMFPTVEAAAQAIVDATAEARTA